MWPRVPPSQSDGEEHRTPFSVSFPLQPRPRIQHPHSRGLPSTVMSTLPLLSVNGRREFENEWSASNAASFADSARTSAERERPPQCV